MKKKSKAFLLAIGIFLQLMMCINSNLVWADEISKTDPNLDVEVNVYVRDLGAPDGYRLIISNGVVVGGSNNAVIEQGQSVKFEILWSLQNADTYDEGDYFKVEIPESYFVFNFTDKPYEIVINNTEEVIGQFEVVAGNGVTITLNENGANKSSLTDGYVWFTGTATVLASDLEEIKVFGEVLPLVIGETSNTLKPIGNDRGLFYKGGEQGRGTNEVRWELLVNIENYVKAIAGNSYELLTDVMVIDDLGSNQTIGYNYSLTELKNRIAIQTPIFAVSEQNELSGHSIARPTIDFGGEPTIVIGSDGIATTSYDTYTDLDEFITYLNGRTEKYIWAIYETGTNREQTIVLKLPDMSTVSISSSSYNTVAKLEGRIDGAFIKATEKATTKARYQALQDSNGGVIPVIAYRIAIHVDLFDEEVNKVENNAILRYGSSESVTRSVEVAFLKYGAGVLGLGTGKLEITKLDGNTNANITGATFKLQIYNTITSTFEDYIPRDSFPAIRPTVNGKVSFEKLVPGKYKIIEVDPVMGYDLNKVVFVTSDEFTLLGSETEAIKLTILNYPSDIPVASKPTPEVPKTSVANDDLFHYYLLLVSSYLLVKTRKVLLEK